jgi:hypothetical protein
MSTTELITQPRASSPPEPSSGERDDDRSAYPTFAETVDETLPLVDVVPLYGPPVVLLVGPWVLLSLTLAGPFAVLVTFVVVLAALAAIAALIGAIIVAPYVLARHIRADWAARASKRTASAPVVARASRWGAA